MTVAVDPWRSSSATAVWDRRFSCKQQREQRTVASSTTVPLTLSSTRGEFGRFFSKRIKEKAKPRPPLVDRPPAITAFGRHRIRILLPACASSSSKEGNQHHLVSTDHSELVKRAGEVLSMAYPLWIALACTVALWRPSSYTWVDERCQITGLTIAMLGMGMTLTLDDLKSAMLMPKELITGFILQYTVMPLSGFICSKLLKLPSCYAAGLILVGCCPGGTASNIITYLARGNVALSVMMTTTSTISAVVMTPFLTCKLAGQFVAVDPVGLLNSTVQMVLCPVLIGAFANQYCSQVVKFVSPMMPLIAVATSATLCGSVVAQNASAILSSGFQVVLASCILHTSGFLFGYALSRLLGLDISTSRTISIEVGMQNALLGLVLASRHFANPLTTVPCAVSSVSHLIFGSFLVGIWRWMKLSDSRKL